MHTDINTETDTGTDAMGESSADERGRMGRGVDAKVNVTGRSRQRVAQNHAWVVEEEAEAMVLEGDGGIMGYHTIALVASISQHDLDAMDFDTMRMGPSVATTREGFRATAVVVVKEEEEECELRKGCDHERSPKDSEAVKGEELRKSSTVPAE
ncbi:hypothetical protein BGW80DRAFT_1248259 [Lactifluus volemus]|nr:hypothetical protein BGW80DRAFT_1248259 [Lactifluus volemus]